MLKHLLQDSFSEQVVAQLSDVRFRLHVSSMPFTVGRCEGVRRISSACRISSDLHLSLLALRQAGCRRQSLAIMARESPKQLAKVTC